MRVNHFTEIGAWSEARALARLIYEMTSKSEFKRDFGLSGQIQRAAVSSMANIAEGFSRDTNKEFIRYLYISRGSNMEVQSHLHIAEDLNYISKSEFEGAIG